MGLFLLPAYRGLFLFYGHIKSPRPLAQAIAAHLEEDDIVAQFGTYEQALPFYLKRTNVLIGYRGELDYGVCRDSPSWFLDAEGLLPLLEGEKRVFLVIKRRAFEEFGDDLAGLFTLAEWDNTLVVVNRPLEVN
jgi:hypothetical protein